MSGVFLGRQTVTSFVQIDGNHLVCVKIQTVWGLFLSIGCSDFLRTLKSSCQFKCRAVIFQMPDQSKATTSEAYKWRLVWRSEAAQIKRRRRD